MKINVFSFLFLVLIAVFGSSAPRFTVEWKPHFDNTAPGWYFPIVVLSFVAAPYFLGYAARKSEEE